MDRIVTLTLNPALDLSTEAPEVLPDLKLRCAQPRADAGGGGVNVARAISFLGGRATAAVALGGGTGARVRDLLEHAGINLIELGGVPETRENMSVICRQTGRQFRFIMPGARWSAGDLDAVRAILLPQLRKGDMIVPSGSLPPGVDAAAFMDLMHQLGTMGLRVVLDTSGEALRIAARTPRDTPLALLRMDLDEAEALCGRSLPGIADVAELARQLSGSGVAQAVVIAKGAEGSVLSLAAGGLWHVRPPKVDVISKTGAGDSFVAGYTLSLARGQSPLEACVLGVGAASSTVTTPDTDLCCREDAERFAAQATVTTL